MQGLEVLQSHSKLDCLADVGPLSRLVAAHQQDHEPVFSLRIVDAVARAVVDLQLGDAVGELAVLAGIPVGQALDASLNAGAALQIVEVVEPAFEVRCRFDLHERSVS
jgi:hypothetical protein